MRLHTRNKTVEVFEAGSGKPSGVKFGVIRNCRLAHGLRGQVELWRSFKGCERGEKLFRTTDIARKDRLYLYTHAWI